MDSIFSHSNLIYTVYQEGSFSRAAQKLFISQPSLSVLVKKTEEEIGTPLFDRTHKPVRLTKAGEQYIKAVANIRHIEEGFNDYISAVNNLQAGFLRIGSNQLLSSLVLPSYVSKFICKYPQIQLNLVDSNSLGLKNKIMLGELDLIIDNQELDPENFINQTLRTEYLLLAVPRAFPCNQEAYPYQLTYQDILDGRHMAPDFPAVPLSLFSKSPFILMTKDNDTRNRSTAIFQQYDFNPPVILEVDRLVTLYNFLEIGTAASIVSDTLIQHIKNIDATDQKIVFYKLSSPHAKRDITLSYKQSKHYSKTIAAFTELIASFE